MSTCTSDWGEFSEHEYTGQNITCDYCGKTTEASHVDNLRRVLDAVLELHSRQYASVGDEVYELNPLCENCGTAFPCDTRKLIESERGT